LKEDTGLHGGTRGASAAAKRGACAAHVCY
jgi:hypothetical protein